MTRPAAPLRALHATVFLGLTAFAVIAAEAEWTQLLRMLTAPFSYGVGPDPVALGGSALSLAGAAWMAWGWGRHRVAPLAASVLVLAGAVVAGVVRSQGQPTRSAEAANRRLVEVAAHVEREMAQVLQREGELPPWGTAWEQALQTAAGGESPVRVGLWGAAPIVVTRLLQSDARPPARPGTLWVWVSEDAAAFEIVPVGFSADGGFGPLADERGEPLVLRTTYDPQGGAGR